MHHPGATIVLAAAALALAAPGPSAAQQDEDQDGPADAQEEPEGQDGAQTSGPDAQDDAGPMYVLEDIELEGNHKTADSTILFFVDLDVGETFSPHDERLEKNRYTLLATGWFSSVEFSLKKGELRDHVILVIRVQERSTFVIRDLTAGITHITPFGGISVADYNFLGRGINLGGGVVVGSPHLGFDLRFTHPFIFHSRFSLGLQAYYLKGNDWMGFDDVVAVWPGSEDPLSVARVGYVRRGGVLSLGFDIIPQFSLGLLYRLEVVDGSMPVAASHRRNGMTEAIDFGLLSGRSFISTITGLFEYDSRNEPFLPSKGLRITLSAEISSPLFGSSYSFTKFTAEYNHYFRLPWKHVLKVNVFAGLIAGDAPFFERFYLGDFTDFIPGRVMGMAFDHRQSPNVFNTSIESMRYEDIAARLELEYAVPLYRSDSGVYGVDFFFSFGLFSLARARDLHLTGEGQQEKSPFPIDLTSNIGFRVDTVAGYFELSLANIMGLVPLKGD